MRKIILSKKIMRGRIRRRSTIAFMIRIVCVVAFTFIILVPIL